MPVFKNKETELKELVKEINCPLKALSLEASGDSVTCMCNYPNAIDGKKPLGQIVLGNIKEDVLNHCNKCKAALKQLEMFKKEDSVKLVEIDENQEVTCVANAKKVDVMDSCSTCPFFNAKKMKEMSAANKEDEEIRCIPCSYPNLPSESRKLFLEKKLKAMSSSKKKSKAESAA